MASLLGFTRLSALIAGLSAIGGCVLDAGEKTTCVTQQDCLEGFFCVRERCTVDPTWGCLEVGGLIEPSDEPVDLSVTVLDDGNESPIPGVTVRVCSRADVLCVDPMQVSVSDRQGVVGLTMVDEYLEFSVPGYRTTIAMGLSSLEVTVAGPPIEAHFDMFSESRFAATASGTGVVLDERWANLEVLARDCAYESVEGVQLAIDALGPSTTRRYLVNDLPSLSATETDRSSGAALFFNTLPGIRTVTATIAVSGALVTASGPRPAAIARPGWLTHLAVLPAGVTIREARGD